MFTDSKHMEAINYYVKNYREKAGYPSARSFYKYAEQKCVLGFNYSYYTRIESGSAFPSIAIIRQLASCLPPEFGEDLILKFCSELFPENRKLFISRYKKGIKTDPSQSRPRQVQVKQQELTLKQISTLGKSQYHYYCFLMLTIARHSLRLEEFNFLNIEEERLKMMLRDLIDEKIAYQDHNNKFASVDNEFKFPSAYNEQLKEQYKILDSWDQSLPEVLGLNVLKRKFLFRRTSPNYITLIMSLLNYTDELVKSSEDLDDEFNSEVFMLEYRFASTDKIAG